MKSLFLVLPFSISALAQQQQSPFSPRPTGPAPTPPAQQQPATPPAADTGTPPATTDPAIPTDPTGGGSTVTNRPSSVPVTVFEGRVGENQITMPGGGPATNATAARGALGAQGMTAQNQQQAASSPLFLNISGTAVLDATGQPIGTIQQVVLTPSGSVSFAVVNMGGRLVPVPWQLIGASGVPGRSGLVVNADRGLIQRAPPVLMSQLPALTQDAMINQIYSYYNMPVPNRTTVGTTGTAQGRPGGLGTTITGGATNAGFGGAPIPTNTVGGTVTVSNQATVGGQLSPTGQTNGIFNPGPATTTNRVAPRQNAGPQQPQPPR